MSKWFLNGTTETQQIEITKYILSKKRTIRQLFSDLHSEDRDGILNRIINICEEKEKEEEKQIQLNKEKQEKIENIIKFIKENELEELIFNNENSEIKQTRKKRQSPKFLFNFDSLKLELGLAGRNSTEVIEFLESKNLSGKDKWKFIDYSDRNRYINYLFKNNQTDKLQEACKEFNIPNPADQ
ncbi:TPA: hypothetical protein ACX6S1_003829 [Photobacterium damselae]